MEGSRQEARLTLRSSLHLRRDPSATARFASGSLVPALCGELIGGSEDEVRALCKGGKNEMEKKVWLALVAIFGNLTKLSGF